MSAPETSAGKKHGQDWKRWNEEGREMIVAYIDPGTGSMLFSLVIGAVAAVTFGLRALILKLKYGFNRDKAAEEEKSAYKYVIFSDHKRYWNVFEGICREFDRRGIDVKYYTLSQDDPVFSCGLEHIDAEYLGEGNRPYSTLNFLSADIVLATTPNLDVYQWKRSRNVKWYVHVPHTVDDLSGYRMFGLDHYDAVLTTGDNQIETARKLEELRPSITRKELVTVGSATLDALMEKLEKKGRHVRTDDRLTVLLAPTWGPSGILSRFGDRLLSELEKTGYNVIVRPHPQSLSSEKELVDKLKASHKGIEWNSDNDNFDVLNRADVLITDFSGIIFDFSLVFDKPVIYADTSFDPIIYDADWLNEEYWSIRILPELGLKLTEENFSGVGELVKEAVGSSILAAGRKRIGEICYQRRGESAVLSVDYLVNKQKVLSV